VRKNIHKGVAVLSTVAINVTRNLGSGPQVFQHYVLVTVGTTKTVVKRTTHRTSVVVNHTITIAKKLPARFITVAVSSNITRLRKSRKPITVTVTSSVTRLRKVRHGVSVVIGATIARAKRLSMYRLIQVTATGFFSYMRNALVLVASKLNYLIPKDDRTYSIPKSTRISVVAKTDRTFPIMADLRRMIVEPLLYTQRINGGETQQGERHGSKGNARETAK
jgi:hypothetical protein